MTRKQNWLYWREWRAVQQVCQDNGHAVPDRHDLHLHALGDDKSHDDFTNDDFDKVLAEMRSISRPSDLDGQVRLAQMARTRIIWRIHHQADREYWAAIARDKFGTDILDDLTEEQLVQLRNTLCQRHPGESKHEHAHAGPAGGGNCPF